MRDDELYEESMIVSDVKEEYDPKNQNFDQEAYFAKHSYKNQKDENFEEPRSKKKIFFGLFMIIFMLAPILWQTYQMLQ